MLFDIFGGGEECDDISVLPWRLQEPYTNPYKVMGVDRETSTVALLRDAFRRQAIAMIPHFAGFNVPRFGEDQLNLAYHLIRGTLKGPAAKIASGLAAHELPQLDFKAEYILPTLRPMLSDFPCRSEYRGFRMMSVTSAGSHLEYPSYELKSLHTTLYGIVPALKYDFDVHYMLRRHTVSLEYAAFQQLNAELERELLSVPELPQNIGTRQQLGAALAQYAQRVHVQLASQGLFSPRLLRFLGVDFERVQTEEEGAIVAILDTGKKPAATAWHLLDEDWLARWRLYAMGRGPRRYFPPGRIDNRQLLADFRRGKADKELRKVEHYRCVNFNVWRFYQLVHGGGPVIARLEEDIYGPRALSYLQACIVIQSWMRLCLSKKRHRFLLMQRVSASSLGRAVIIETALQKVHDIARKYISDNSKARKIAKLKDACIFTQNTWRTKKNYKPEKQLVAIQDTHRIFRAVKGLQKDVAKSAAEGEVIENEQPILRIGNTNVYERSVYNTSQGLPFRLQRIPGTQLAVIVDPAEPDEFKPRSLLLAIAGYPTNVLTFEEIKSRLAAAAAPFKLTLEQELERKLVPTVDQLLQLQRITDSMVQQSHGGVNPLVFNAFKVMARYGMFWIKHTSGDYSWDNSSHLTKVRITDKQFFYTHRFDPTKEEDEQWSSFYLYKLKFVLRNGKQVSGHNSSSSNNNNSNEATEEAAAEDAMGSSAAAAAAAAEAVSNPRKTPSDTIKRKHGKLLRQEYCFEVVTDDRGIVFEVPTNLRLAKLLLEEREARKQHAQKEQQVKQQRQLQEQRHAMYEKTSKGSGEGSNDSSAAAVVVKVRPTAAAGGDNSSAADETQDGLQLPSATDDSSQRQQRHRRSNNNNSSSSSSSRDGIPVGKSGSLLNSWWSQDAFCAAKITEREFGPERFFCSAVGLPLAVRFEDEELPAYQPDAIFPSSTAAAATAATYSIATTTAAVAAVGEFGDSSGGGDAAAMGVQTPQMLQRIRDATLPNVAHKSSVEDGHSRRCELLFECLQQLVLEVRKSQIYVDKDGLPLRRTQPKRSLMRYPLST